MIKILYYGTTKFNAQQKILFNQLYWEKEFGEAIVT
jgi:hypothetical protein